MYTNLNYISIIYNLQATDFRTIRERSQFCLSGNNNNNANNMNTIMFMPMNGRRRRWADRAVEGLENCNNTESDHYYCTDESNCWQDFSLSFQSI